MAGFSKPGLPAGGSRKWVVKRFVQTNRPGGNRKELVGIRSELREIEVRPGTGRSRGQVVAERRGILGSARLGLPGLVSEGPPRVRKGMGIPGPKGSGKPGPQGSAPGFVRILGFSAPQCAGAGRKEVAFGSPSSGP